MRRPSYLLGGALGMLMALPVMAVSYLGNQWGGLPFLPFDLFDWLARVLPGQVITLGIDTMVRLITRLGLGPISAVAKSLEQLQGIGIMLFGAAGLGLLQTLLLRRTRWSGEAIGGLVGAAAFGLFIGIEARLGALALQALVPVVLWLLVLTVGWGMGLGIWLAGGTLPFVLPPESPEVRLGRRSVLKLIGASLGTAVLASVAGGWLAWRRQLSGAGQPLPITGSLASGTPTLPPVSTPAAAASPVAGATGAPQDAVSPVPGTRPEVTPTDEFYRIDIDTTPPYIAEQDWKLQVSGLFDRPRALTLADLMAYPAVTQPITLSCISNPVGGDLIGTSYWTGASLPAVLQDLGLRPEAQALRITAADGFYESVELDDMRDPRTLLVYGMNGATLPQAHGFPLRIYIPNRYGMKQPKWITSIEAATNSTPGYWVDRGWSREASPQIVSVIDAVAQDQVQDGRVPIGGIAWAGGRGIQKVEVQVDNGAWTPAALRAPPLGPLTWVQWRYDWPLVKGHHVFQVRATDGLGNVQISTPADTYPDGATGYHSVEATL